MCGRYRLIGYESYGELNDVRITPRFTPSVRYNIAPTQKVAVVLDESPQEFSELRWGLIPSWSKDASAAAKMINARCETVADKPAYRIAFKKRRCLVPADGFYEWQKVGVGKQPYNIGLKSDEPFAFAGLWESWRNAEGDEVRTCTIITTTPNLVTERIHDRMPVILPLEARKRWLDPGTSRETLLSLLVPFDAAQMTAYPISPRVGKPMFDDPEIIKPLVATSKC
jgi:putative SOS response-associated peptidase YedK